jgi:large subunit ribosomal protein L30
MAKIRITLIKSPIGYNKKQRATAQALGLRKLQASVIQEDTPDILGKVASIAHLVKCEPYEEEEIIALDEAPAVAAEEAPKRTPKKTAAEAEKAEEDKASEEAAVEEAAAEEAAVEEAAAEEAEEPTAQAPKPRRGAKKDAETAAELTATDAPKRAPKKTANKDAEATAGDDPDTEAEVLKPAPKRAAKKEPQEAPPAQQ